MRKIIASALHVCLGMTLILLVLMHDAPLHRSTLQHNCRFWGIIYEEKEDTVLNVIHSHLDSLQSLGTHHDDGWGIAYYVDPIRKKTLPVIERGGPEAALDPRFTRAVDNAAAHARNTVIAHIRSASSGPQSGIPDPHPFSRYSAYRTYHMFFAHNGTINTDVLLNLIKTTNLHYLELNPPDYAPEFLDSDLYALFLIELIDMNSKKSIEECIRIAVTKIDSAIPFGSVQCNFVMTDGTRLYAVNYSSSPIDALTLYLYAPTGRSDFWAVASEPLDDQQHFWIAIPNSTLVVLTPNAPPRFLDVLIEQDHSNETPILDIIESNPATTPVTILFSIPDRITANTDHQIRIYNSAGQLVKILSAAENHRENVNVVTWHGLDEQGNHAPSGSYYCQLALQDTAFTKKFIYIR